MIKLKRLVASLAASLLLLSACGGGGDSSTPDVSALAGPGAKALAAKTDGENGPKTSKYRFRTSGVANLDFNNYSQIKISGLGADKIISFSQGATWAVYVYPNASTYAHLSDPVAYECDLSGTKRDMCSVKEGMISYTDQGSLYQEGSILQFKFSDGNVLFLRIDDPYRQIDGDPLDGVKLSWYSTEAGVQITPFTYGTVVNGSNASGDSTRLEFNYSGTVSFDNGAQLAISNIAGGVSVSMSHCGGGCTWLYGPGLSKQIQALPNSCQVAGDAIGCDLNLANFTFSDSAKMITKGQYALLMGSNNQYFLVQVLDSVMNFVGDQYVGGRVDLKWYSTTSATSTSVIQ